MPVTSPRLRAELRQLLDLQLGNTRNVWEMQADGSSIQRSSTACDGAVCIHRTLIDRAKKRLTAYQRAGRKKKTGDRKKG